MSLLSRRESMPPVRHEPPAEPEQEQNNTYVPRRHRPTMSDAARAAAQHVSDLEGHVAFLESQIRELTAANDRLTADRDSTKEKAVKMKTKLEMLGQLLLDILDENKQALDIDVGEARRRASEAGLLGIRDAVLPVIARRSSDAQTQE